jgi:hypothetical protein
MGLSGRGLLSPTATYATVPRQDLPMATIVLNVVRRPDADDALRGRVGVAA